MIEQGGVGPLGEGEEAIRRELKIREGESEVEKEKEAKREKEDVMMEKVQRELAKTGGVPCFKHWKKLEDECLSVERTDTQRYGTLGRVCQDRACRT